MTSVSFFVEYPARPWTTNGERASSRWERARLTKEWRLGFSLAVAEKRMPKLRTCTITAEPWLLNRRGMQDTGACHPAVKAGIDGLVDAGLIADDTPDIVTEITFRAPRIGRDALILIIEGTPE